MTFQGELILCGPLICHPVEHLLGAMVTGLGQVLTSGYLIVKSLLGTEPQSSGRASALSTGPPLQPVLFFLLLLFLLLFILKGFIL